MVKAGLVECAMALGFERMARGSLGSAYPDRPSPTAPLHAIAVDIEPNLSTGTNHGPWAPRLFANAGQEYFDKYGATIEHLAQIGMDIQLPFLMPAPETCMLAASKNHKHSVNNPYSQFRDGWTAEQVLASPKICDQLTKFMCSPTSVRPLPNCFLPEISR